MSTVSERRQHEAPVAAERETVTFAYLADYLRDYRDCSDAYSETSKLEVTEVNLAGIPTP
ncbi:hypothetical protein D9M71_784460 [compost metagenome]